MNLINIAFDSVIINQLTNVLTLAAQIFVFWLVTSLLLMYLTFVHFGAVMRARQLRDSKTITWQTDKMLWTWLTIVLVVGLVLDFLLNVYTASVVLLEFPREWLTTHRLIRWHHTTRTDWYTRTVRRGFVALGKTLLDKMDTDGIHIT